MDASKSAEFLGKVLASAGSSNSPEFWGKVVASAYEHLAEKSDLTTTAQIQNPAEAKELNGADCVAQGEIEKAIRIEQTVLLEVAESHSPPSQQEPLEANQQIQAIEGASLAQDPAPPAERSKLDKLLSLCLREPSGNTEEQTVVAELWNGPEPELDLTEASNYVDLCKPTFQKKVASGEIQPIPNHPGRGQHFYLRDLNAWIDQHELPAVEQPRFSRSQNTMQPAAESLSDVPTAPINPATTNNPPAQTKFEESNP